jgi:hypothetical protein
VHGAGSKKYSGLTEKVNNVIPMKCAQSLNFGWHVLSVHVSDLVFELRKLVYNLVFYFKRSIRYN